MQVAVSDCVIFLVLSAFNNTSQVKELWHQVFIICLPPLRFHIFLTFSLLYLNIILSLTTLHTHLLMLTILLYFTFYTSPLHSRAYNPYILYVYMQILSTILSSNLFVLHLTKHYIRHRNDWLRYNFSVDTFKCNHLIPYMSYT